MEKEWLITDNIIIHRKAHVINRNKGILFKDSDLNLPVSIVVKPLRPLSF